MDSLIVKDFNLFHTLDSGQLFTFYESGDYYYILANNAVFKVKQVENKLFYDGKKYGEGKVTEADVIELFDLGGDQSFDVIDPYLATAKEMFSGLRIMKQNVYDTTLGFLLSQMNNIPRITQLSKILLDRSSRTINFDGKQFKLFPLPNELPSEKELVKARFGYRSKYLSNLVKHEPLFSKLEQLDYETAKKELMKIEGVGTKVADCILLFSCKRYNSFPVDTHITKIMKKAYKNAMEDKYKRHIDNVTQLQVEAFGKEIYGNKCGLVQQYLFQLERKTKP